MRLFHVRALATVGVAAFALAACGSSSKPSSSPGTTAAPATTLAPDSTTAASSTTVAPAAATVAVATSAKLGKIVVDSKGRTLYRFENDTSPGASTCTTPPCSTTWPAATVTGTPVAGTGVDDSKLSTFTTADGKKQLQMDGHPLYTFAGDSKAGDTNGQGLLDKWYAVTPDGEKAGDKS